jgi:hypothetical protein
LEIVAQDNRMATIYGGSRRAIFMKKITLTLMLILLPIVFSCGGGGGGGGSTSNGGGGGTTVPNYAAVLQKSFEFGDAAFGALMLDTNGEMLLPTVSRDSSGNITGVTGAVWYDPSGPSVTVSLDETTHLPTNVVFGDFVLLFSNWSSDQSKVDIAKVYTYGGGYIKIWRQASVSLPGTTTSSNDSVALDAAKSWCLPNCATDAQTLANLLSVAGTGISLGVCGVASTVSLGALALPCSGLIATTAAAVTGDETWLGNLDNAAAILAGMGAFGCAGNRDSVGCLTRALALGSKMLEGGMSGGQNITGSVTVANDLYAAAASNDFQNGSITNGQVVAGSDIDLPSCAKGTPDSYQCTPGGMISYEPCYPDGYKQCQADCTWSACLASGTTPPSGGGSTGNCNANYNDFPPHPDYWSMCPPQPQCNVTTCCGCTLGVCIWSTPVTVLGDPNPHQCHPGSSGYIINNNGIVISGSLLTVAEKKFNQCLAAQCSQ